MDTLIAVVIFHILGAQISFSSTLHDRWDRRVVGGGGIIQKVGGIKSLNPLRT